jgi:hypothetical protein
LGGLLATVTLWFTYKKHRLDQDADWTGRYSASVAQLADPVELVRIGGLYALERIARDSPKDREMISRVLASFLRQPPHEAGLSRPKDGSAPISPAVFVAAEVFGRVSQLQPLPEGLDLTHTYLVSADLRGAKLAGINLTGATLRDASLHGADLARADLYDANLEHAFLVDADLRGATFFKANLRNAVWHGAHLEAARFFRKGVNQASATGWNAPALNGAASWDASTIWPKGHTPTPSVKP